MSASWSEVMPAEPVERPLVWALVTCAIAFGLAVGLTLAVALIPDPPARILVPVHTPTQPAPPPTLAA